MNCIRLLLVEDEDPKRHHIQAFLQTVLPDAGITMSRSVRSALAALKVQVPDLMILDMSLPTFDIGENESGGRPQGDGGEELLRIMELEEISCPVVILTGYESFSKAGGQVGLESLAREIADNYPDMYKGIFHYSSAYGNWKENLEYVFQEMGFLK